MKIVQRPRVGGGVLLLRGEKFLLGRRNDDYKKAGSELRGEGTWTMPGGKLEFGETPRECVVRETLEETGIQINVKDLKLISVSNDKVLNAHYITLGFLCEQFDGEAETMEPEKITEWKWFPIDSPPSPMFLPSKKVLQNYQSKQIYLE